MTSNNIKKYLADFPNLMKEWDSELNKPLDPNKVLAGSGKKVGWICSKCGKHWSAVIGHRTKDGSGCPACSHKEGGRKRTTAVAGVNDLATTHKELAEEWLYPVDDKYSWHNPSNTYATSTIAVRWKCRVCGYEWVAQVNTRTGQGTGCKKCGLRSAAIKRSTAPLKESIATTHPELVKEWISAVNEIDRWKNPFNTRISSETLVHWKCSYCGKEWDASVYSRKKLGAGCRTCHLKRASREKAEASSFETSLSHQYPEVAKEWVRPAHPGDSGRTAENTKSKSNISVIWKCSICGHMWEAPVYSRTSGTGCPECYKRVRPFQNREWATATFGVDDLETCFPEMAKEWISPVDSENESWRTPKNTKKGANCKIHWKCSICGNEWNATVVSRTSRKTGCPRCGKVTKTSRPEWAIYYYLNKIDPTVRHGVPLMELIPSNRIDKRHVDIYIQSKRIAIEYDGAQFHNENTTERDLIKEQDLINAGYSFIRVKECSTLTHIVEISGNSILYRSKPVNKYLDEAILTIIREIYGDVRCEIDSQGRDWQIIEKLRVGERVRQSIASHHPELIKEWSEKNILTPWQISYGSNQKVWWICPIHGPYLASPKARSRGNGCPLCANKSPELRGASLADIRPDLAEQWDFCPENRNLTPRDVGINDLREVQWKCNRCGYTWSAKIKNRAKRSGGCPKCHYGKIPGHR